MTTENKRKHERIRSLNLSYICLDEDNNIVKQGILFDRKIDISPFPRGVYFLRLTYDDTSVTKKYHTNVGFTQ